MKKLLVKLYVSFFGNKLPLLVNIINSVYFFLTKLNFFFVSRKVKTNITSDKIKKFGYSRIKVESLNKLIDELSQKVKEQFDNGIDLDYTYATSGLIHLKNSMLHYPELTSIVYDDQVKSVISNFLNTNYRVFSSNIYRTVPKDNIANSDFSSVDYHFDNMPSSHLKLMVYLTDTNEKNGALKIIDRKFSKQLRSRGFWDRKSEKFTHIIEDNKIILEGEKGTFIFFYPHDTIHKATLPDKGYRDVLNFILIPSFKPFQNLNRHESKKISNQFFGYCKNPFKY